MGEKHLYKECRKYETQNEAGNKRQPVPIFKKGDPTYCENYSVIQSLYTVYKYLGR